MLLLGYAMLLLAISQTSNIAGASGRAANSSSTLDPTTLSVLELKSLIKGTVTIGELREISQRTNESVLIFTSLDDFSGEVEETKSVWLVLVVPEQSHKFSSWDEVTFWEEIHGKLSPFGVRLGVLDCSFLPVATAMPYVPGNNSERRRWTWLKPMLLLGYAMLLLAISQTSNIAGASGRAANSSSTLDPTTLSVLELKSLIKGRGLHGTSAIEKKDMVQLVKSTGTVTIGELREISQRTNESVLMFTSLDDFSGEVEETKSVWLVLVVPEQSHKFSSWDEVTFWEEIHGKLSPFGVRLGVLDCSFLPVVCERKKWDRPLILLTFPRELNSDNQVIINGYIKPNVMLKRIEETLKIHVQDIKTVEELESEWLDPSQQADGGPLRVVFFTDAEVIPLFLATLQAKFKGRIQFGAFSSRIEPKVAHFPVCEEHSKDEDKDQGIVFHSLSP
ncbi:unnamed protein product [Darwinula stevensoni]|uniref:Uncharacterized protein n=1 Tax=Darwinula stevensoni TaxID=69355 RepID=A0A7R9A1Q3_9CRUS|nr:unnamed protein product [Darwinula stevensoni]CAG0887116.1 unnamed protein product [Darwinula stevensoni]